MTAGWTYLVVLRATERGQISLLSAKGVLLVMSKIDGVFEYAKRNQVTFVNDERKSKTNNSRGTWDDYCAKIKTMENWCKETFGLKDITRVKPKHTEAFLNHLCQSKSPYTAKAHIHAIHAFKTLATESKIYRRMDIGEKQMLLSKVVEPYGLSRKASESSCLKANQNDYEKVLDGLSKSRSKQKEEIKSIHMAQRLVGCRISEAIGMRKQDITVNQDGSCTVYIKGKGGHERWVRVVSKEGTDFLKARINNDTRGDTTVFNLKDSKGNDKGFRESVAMVKDAITKAADRSNAHRDGKRYSSHSGRKVYAQERVNEFAQKTKTQLKRELKRRIERFPLDKDGNNKLKQKYENELEKLREKINLTIPGKRTAKQGEALRKERHMTHKELCLFLVSVETGHFRINIMRYYCDYPGDLSPKE